MFSHLCVRSTVVRNRNFLSVSLGPKQQHPSTGAPAVCLVIWILGWTPEEAENGDPTRSVHGDLAQARVPITQSELRTTGETVWSCSTLDWQRCRSGDGVWLPTLGFGEAIILSLLMANANI